MLLQSLKEYGPDLFAASYRMLPEEVRGAIYIAIREDIPDRALSKLERIMFRSYDPIKVYEQAARELGRPYFKALGDGQNALGVQEVLSAFALSEIVESFLATIAKAEQEGTIGGLDGLRAVAGTFNSRLADLAQAIPAHVRSFVAARLKAEHAAGKSTEQVAEDALKQRAEGIREEERLRIFNAMTAPGGIDSDHCPYCCGHYILLDGSTLPCDGATSKERIRAFIYEAPKP